MKKFTQYAQQGFTLIEILIVVVIIGVLAVGLIAALDPFEQIRKSQDTTLQASAKQTYDALVRYNGQNGYFPWGASATDACPVPSASNVNDATPVATAFNQATTGCLTLLINAGEVASSFLSNLGTTTAQKLLVTSTTNGAVVCFIPASKSFLPRATFTSTGTGGQTPAAGSTYYCIGN